MTTTMGAAQGSPPAAPTNQSADLAIGLTVSGGLGAQPFTFVITVTNNGPGVLHTAVIRSAHFIPDELMGSVTPSCTYDVWFEDCTAGVVQPGASTQLVFTATKTLSPGPTTITATRLTSTPGDPNPANDSASVVICPVFC